jgi:hypothetical protein
MLLESKAKTKTGNIASVHFASNVRGHRRHFVSDCYIASIGICRSNTVVCCTYADIRSLPFGGTDNSDKNLGTESKHSGAGGKADKLFIGDCEKQDAALNQSGPRMNES